MSNIPFNYLKVSEPRYEMPEPNNMWRFLKSQLGLFAGSPQKQAPMPTKPKNIPFASQKPKESPNIGDVKVEGEHKYIFLETTIGKPRWHTKEELEAEIQKKSSNAKYLRGKKKGAWGLSTDADKKRSEEIMKLKEKLSLLKDKPGSKKEDETKQAMELGKKAFQAGGIRTPSLDKELMKMLEGAQVGEKTHVLKAWNKGWDQENLKKPEEEPKQTEIPSEKLSKPKLSAEEQYVQDQIKKGDLETAIKRQQGMKKNEYTEEQQAKINDLNKLMQRRAQLQREIDAPLTAVKDVEKGGQKFEVDTKKYAKREMKYLDKRIGALKQELGKLGENLFETQEDIFSQATPEPKDQLSENINKQVEEQKKKEAPSLKTLMATQSEVLKLAAIPEEDIPMYALNSMADGAKLRSYSTEVIKGEMTIQQAADKVKNDYTKMKEGEKPTNVAPLPSTEEDNPRADAIEQARKDIERAKELMINAPETSEFDSGIKTKADHQKYIDDTQAWIDRKSKSEKDTLPLRPEDKDSKEGDIKTINGIQYQLKRGESGELRWHRVTEKENKEDWKQKITSLIDRDVFKDIVTESIQNDGQKVLDYALKGNIKGLEDIQNKYIRDKGKDEGGGGAGPGKVSKARSGAVAVWNAAQIAIEKLKSEENKPVVIPRKEAIEEHEHLVEVLENGTEEERKAEAEKQAKELKEYKGESLKEKVEERLSEKQAGKKFKDVGTRVGGSRKEIAAIRVLTAGDLDKLDNATAYRVVTKERILPDINPQAEKDNGVESGAAYMKKKLRESVNAKPPNTPEDRKKFVELTPKIFEKIDAAKTIEDIRTIGNEDFETFMDWGSRKRVTFYKHEDYKSDVSRLLGKEFLNLIGRNSDSAKKHWSDAVLMNSFNEETAKEQYKKYAEGRKNVVEMNKKRMDEYTAEQWERYFKTDPMTTMSFTRRQLTSEKQNNPEKYQQAIEDYKAREYKSNERRNEPITYEEWLDKRPQYKPREADWSWAEAKNKKVIERRKAELKIHDNPPLAFIKRTNGRQVLNSDITVEAIKDKYGFKSVQFGHYVKDVEAQEHVRHFIESMNDLEDALGIDIKKMNQLSGLSIAFGARGSAGALAHYEPMAKIINITKTRGDGTICHELFHNIDHLLGGMEEGTRKEKIYLSQQGIGGYERTKENDILNKRKLRVAMNDVMNAIKKGTNEKKLNFEPGGNKYTYGSIRNKFETEGYEATREYLMKYAKDPDELGRAEDYFKYLSTLANKPIEVIIPTGRTKYYDSAMQFNSKYWQRDQELFARAAEAYVQDKLIGSRMYNNYLVAGNNIQQPDKKWESGSLEITYPQGEERVIINEAFDKLLETAKSELNIGLEKKREGKRVSSEVQMQKSLYNPNIFKSLFRRI